MSYSTDIFYTVAIKYKLEISTLSTNHIADVRLQFNNKADYFVSIFILRKDFVRENHLVK